MNKMMRRVLDRLHVIAVRVEDRSGPHPADRDYIYIAAHAVARWTDRVLYWAHH